jgi:hypothetical protein
VQGWRFDNLARHQSYPNLAAAKTAGAPVIAYGAFFNTVINFVIVAFAIFVLVKQVNRFKKPAAAPTPSTKDCPRCTMRIPLKAMRCPQCTSEFNPAITLRAAPSPVDRVRVSGVSPIGNITILQSGRHGWLQQGLIAAMLPMKEISLASPSGRCRMTRLSCPQCESPDVNLCEGLLGYEAIRCNTCNLETSAHRAG